MTKRNFDKDGSMYLDYQSKLRETDKATLYMIHNEEIWLPNSLIEDDNGEIVVIPNWLGEQRDLESDY